MMDRAKAIDKIKKCLRLARSSNPHEAAAALRQDEGRKARLDHGVAGLAPAPLLEERIP